MHGEHPHRYFLHNGYPWQILKGARSPPSAQDPRDRADEVTFPLFSQPAASENGSVPLALDTFAYEAVSGVDLFLGLEFQ